jgi:MFS family permease
VAVSFVGAAGAYFLMAFLYAVSGIALFLIPDSRRPRTGGQRSVFGDMIDGFKYVKSQPRLRWMLILFFSMIVLGLSPVAVVMPGLLENVLGEDIDKFGILQTVNAVGGLAASFAVAGIASSPRALTVYSAGALLTGVALVLTGLAPNLAILFIPMFLTGLGTGAFQTLNSAVIVVESEPEYYGRVISLTSLAFAGFMLAGYPVGLAADAFGERETLVVMGIATVVLVLLISPIIARSRPIQTAAERRQEREATVAGGG